MLLYVNVPMNLVYNMFIFQHVFYSSHGTVRLFLLPNAILGETMATPFTGLK
jgi:hypothetical protein